MKALLLVFALASHVYAQPAWQASCERVKDAVPPSRDQPAREDVADPLKACNSESLYYGIGVMRDAAAARNCAFAEIARKDATVFGGNAMLMMIYANGLSVERNFDLALHFACRLDGAPAEMEGRIGHLQRLKRAQWNGHNFDLCQDITSGLMGGHCAAHNERIAGEARRRRLAVVAAEVAASHREAFGNLQDASEAFIKARVENEVDLSGTLRVAFQVHEEATLREDYLQMLEMFAKGRGHHYSAAQLQARTAEMDTLLASIIKAPLDQDTWGTITPAGIKATQAAWTGYRDAFAAFAMMNYRNAPDYSVKAWLTAKRIHQLKGIIS